MKTTTQLCAHCGVEFEYPLKEYTRQTKRGRKDFYCSLSCSAYKPGFHGSAKTINNGPAVAAARVANTKYKTPWHRDMLAKCRQRGREFNLTDEFLDELWESQSGRCALTGIEIFRGEGPVWRHASIDRIDCMRGYTQDNVQFVCKPANWARNSMTIEEFQAFLTEVTL